MFGMPLGVHRGADRHRPTWPVRDAGGRRSVSSRIFARCPMLPIRSSSGSTSTRCIRWRTSISRRGPWCCRCPRWATAIGWCSSSTRGTTSRLFRARGRWRPAGTSRSSARVERTLPDGLTELRMPTSLGILAGRTYVSGAEDVTAVHALQDQFRLVPLKAWASDWTPPTEVPVQPGVDAKTPVPRQVLAMTPEAFFARLNALLVANPPYTEDAAVMARSPKLGIATGAQFRRRASNLPCRKRSPPGDGPASRRSMTRKHTWASPSMAGRSRSTWAATAPATSTERPGRSSVSAAI